MVGELLNSPFVNAGLVLAALVALVVSYVVAGRIAAATAGSDDDAVRKIARNSLVPIASQLVIRGSDLAVAIVLLRLLGPEGNGRYAIAVVVWLYVKTLSDFGLSLLATADIARNHAVAGRIVGETTILRWFVLAVSGLPVTIYTIAGLGTASLATESAIAILVLYLSIIPSSFAEAVNSALNGFERMEVGAWLNIGISAVRAPLAIVLAGWLGVEGVALAALVAATISADLYRRTALRSGVGDVVWSLGRERARSLAMRSWPLLINALLVNLFFRVDVFILQAFKGDEALGIYDAAYKLINLVTIVPAYVTLALFPTMAQRAGEPDALDRTLRLSSYLLVWIAWGIVVATSALADTAIRVLAGSNYLPDAADLLRILIWFAPLSFLNGVVQYALVASEKQRSIVPAFVAAVAGNLVLNLALVPEYGARAAATATVITEVVILVAFAVVVRSAGLRALSLDALRQLWRPTAAGVLAAALGLYIADSRGELAAAAIAIPAFAALSVVLGVFGDRERDLLRRALTRSTARA